MPVLAAGWLLGWQAVLLDLMMPQMNGEKALSMLRAIRSDIPVVIMSGYSEYELTGRFDGIDALSFLQKPFTLQTLYSCINRSIASRLLLEPADQHLSK